MLYYFYLVNFEYTSFEGFVDSFDLGIFSNIKKAQKKINMSIGLSGFNKYNAENFKIIKFGVKFDSKITDKSNVILYQVAHEYENDNGDTTYWIIFGYYSTIKAANEQVDYLKIHTRIGKKLPDKFNIYEKKVDNYNSWSEGFSMLNDEIN